VRKCSKGLDEGARCLLWTEARESRKCELSVFGLDEGARCLLWTEARESKLSTGMIRGISAVIAMIREAMGEDAGNACVPADFSPH